jgi:D-tyrosyl-tRNA(Tyr) deacylase
MRALIQRVKSGKVSVEARTIAEIGHGLIILLGIGIGDGVEQARYLAEKIAILRIFEDPNGKLNRSLLEAGGEAIVISQFTLYADINKGRRPSFSEAARPEIAAPLVEKFTEFLRLEGVPVKTGIFGTHMLVTIENDGPVTLWLEK